MHNFKKLKVWNEAIELAIDIYKVTTKYPDDERFGLTSQLRRATVSVSSNIAEGAGRDTSAQFQHFLNIANGSTNEVISQLYLSNKLGFLSDSELENLEDRADKVQKMIYIFKNQL